MSAVYGYGSSARSNTLLSFCEISSDDLVAIVDNNPLKQGTYTPGTNIPIIGIDQMPKKYHSSYTSLEFCQGNSIEFAGAGFGKH